jgi:type VI secretion system protein ImpM
MACALYGKLPSKRDFVAVAVPRRVLDVLEPWLQGGISASRLSLGDAWQSTFLRAPIWRFWLGAEVCGGVTAAGAFMPSVDGVGRYFPLVVLCCAEGSDSIPPPDLDPQDAWFEKAENLLLSALADGATFEGVTDALQNLPPAFAHLRAEPPGGMVRLPDGTILIPASPASLPGRLDAIRVEDYARAYATRTVWWSVGGEDFPPLALVAQRMPAPSVFTTLLLGQPAEFVA